MRWDRFRRSGNVVDRRGGGFGGGRTGRYGGVRMGRVIGGGGIGTIVLVLIALFLGVDPSFLLGGGGGYVEPAGVPSSTGRSGVPGNDPQAQFVAHVLGGTEEVWNGVFQEQLGQPYQEPRLVLFEGAVSSACGYASAATGPFYCPGDRQIYIDLSFFEELARRFGAPGDFAQAYVIAHEVGHHVQTLLGISQQVADLRRQVDAVEGNRLSVMLELQADCFAGVWARTAEEARQVLESGDVEEGLNAAAAIGDDRLQRQAGGYVTPDSFTHGTSEQRVRWFRTGLETGEVGACDTFNAGRL